jgi:hypothetical protein
MQAAFASNTHKEFMHQFFLLHRIWYLFKASGGAGLVRYSVWLQTGRSGIDPRQRQMIFPVASVSRQVLEPSQLLIQWVQCVLSPSVKRGRSVTLTTHPHQVPRLVMSRNYVSSPPWCLHVVAGQLLLFYFKTNVCFCALSKLSLDTKLKLTSWHSFSMTQIKALLLHTRIYISPTLIALCSVY